MFHHSAGPGFGNEILDLQKRGEYLYTARGKGGFYAYDVANIDNKGFSERIVSSPVSPLGQDLGFDTEHAVAVATPATMAVDPGRTRISDDPSKPRATITEERKPWHPNMERAMHPMYAFLYIGDRKEGLILTNAATLLDGDPTNNFMERATLADGSDAFNPDGKLTGLTNLHIAGHYIYVTTEENGLLVVDIDKPLDPEIVAHIDGSFLDQPRDVAVQFRYAFVTDAEGLKIIEVADPTDPRPVEGALVPLEQAGRLYVSRTNCLVAAGSQGLAIVDVTDPTSPELSTLFNADGDLRDVRDVKVGMVNASLYAMVADGGYGFKVLKLMGPDTTPRFRGFDPPLSPKLIAHYQTHGAALALSEGLDRDRAVDETGNQIAVFGRLGARPMDLETMRRMYMEDGEVWKVTDEPSGEPEPFTYEPPEQEKKQPPRPGGRGPGGGPPGGSGPPGSGGPSSSGGGPPKGGGPPGGGGPPKQGPPK
jgi:hypothetical protein